MPEEQQQQTSPLAAMSAVPMFKSPDLPIRRGAATDQAPAESASPSDLGRPNPAQADRPSYPAATPSGRNGTRTATLATSDEPEEEQHDPKVTTGLVIALVGMAFGAVALAVRARRGKKLRRPTKVELNAIGEPLARIAMRHLPARSINGDLADAAAAAAGFTNYVEAAPLFETTRPDSGVPADLQRTGENL